MDEMRPEPFPSEILNRVPNLLDYRQEVAAWLDSKGWRLDDPKQGVALHRCLTESSKPRQCGFEGQYGVVVVKVGVVRVVNLGEVAALQSQGWMVVEDRFEAFKQAKAAAMLRDTPGVSGFGQTEIRRIYG